MPSPSFFRPQTQRFFKISLLVALFSTGNPVRSDVVLSNLSNGSSYSGGITQSLLDKDRAISFRTNSADWRLTSFSFGVYSTSFATTDFTLRLYNAVNSSGTYIPSGSALYTATLNGASVPLGLANASPATISLSNWDLAANSYYAMEVSSSNAVFWARKGTTFDNTVFTFQNNLVENPGWVSDGFGSNLSFRLEATAVPEPGQFITLGLCLICLVLGKCLLAWRV